MGVRRQLWCVAAVRRRRGGVAKGVLQLQGALKLFGLAGCWAGGYFRRLRSLNTLPLPRLKHSATLCLSARAHRHLSRFNIQVPS